jgi:2-methylcitrate dehydratase PrpD
MGSLVHWDNGSLSEESAVSSRADGYTRAITEYVTRTDYRDIPEAALAATKLHILDALGAMLGAYGTTHPLVQSLIAFTREEGGTGPATLVGSGSRVSCLEAAFVNGVMANFLDFSDGHLMGGHINDRLVPLALAAAERVDASGRDLLTAVALGFEVYIDLAYAFFRKVEPASTNLPLFVMLGVLAGVVPAARLLGLNEEQIAGAMGLAPSLQVGAAQYVLSGGHEKDLSVGHESRRALLSVFLAQRGIGGSPDILEAERGVLRALGAEPSVETTLGREYRITECYFKPYPACRYLHASIEATMNLVKAHNLHAADVDHVVVTTNRSSATRVSYEIHSHVNAIFSHPYQVAAVLYDGRPSLPVAWQEKMQAPEFRDLLWRIRVETEPRYETMFEHRSVTQPPWPAAVEVWTKNGKMNKSEVLAPKGDAANPMSPDEVKRKFMQLAGPALTEVRAAQVVEMVDHLETVQHVSDLIGRLVVR